MEPSISSDKLPFVCNGYEFVKLIGSGGFADIYMVRSIKHNQIFVAKVTSISLQKNIQDKWASYSAEVLALRSLYSPFIIKMYENFRVGMQFVIILEYCQCGSLQDLHMKHQTFSQKQVLTVLYHCASALQKCHSKKIAHRDIKLSNLLRDSYGRIKLSDFGLSIQCNSAKPVSKSFCGSLAFMAPEVFMKLPHDPFQADMWSMGVVFYCIAYGHIPWKGNTEDEIRSAILKASYQTPCTIDQSVITIIRSMLVLEPEERIKADELYNNPLFRDFHKEQPLLVNQAPIHRTISKKQSLISLQFAGTVNFKP